MILVDTSVWIAVFRKKDGFRIEDVVEFDEIATCLPVIQEVLQGFREERAYRMAREAMTALPLVESPMEESGRRRPRRRHSIALHVASHEPR
jgi:predicted nucleic acid-binding protein